MQEEFLRNLPFADSVARSAVDPDDPVSAVGLDNEALYVDSADPYKRGVPGTQLSFAYSYGDPQPVAVNAKRSLGAVWVKYRINGGPVQTAPTSQWAGGQKYTPASVYYHQMRGQVTGTKPGDSVQVWFEGAGETSQPFTYKAVCGSRSNAGAGRKRGHQAWPAADRIARMPSRPAMGLRMDRLGLRPHAAGQRCRQRPHRLPASPRPPAPGVRRRRSTRPRRDRRVVATGTRRVRTPRTRLNTGEPEPHVYSAPCDVRCDGSTHGHR